MAFKLYTYPENFRNHRIILAAEYSGKKLELVTTGLKNGIEKRPIFSKLPVLEIKEGQYLNESNAISYFLSNDQLKGVDELTRAQILQFVSFADNELYQPVVTLVFPALKILQVSGEELKKANEDLTRVLTNLNEELSDKQYLVTDKVTLADLSVVSYLIPLLQNVWDNEKLAKYVNLAKWFNNLISQKEFAVLGDLKLKQAKKKQAAVESKPAVGGDDLLAEPPKPKDPFLQFPAGTFDMDAFKREYSNKSEDESIKYFWEKLDKDNYSIWYCEYLFPQELTKVFMSCNLIGGMMQRLDRMRKHAFGSMCLFGEDNNSTISGIWVWRGHELAFKLSEDTQVDYESYSWKKLDPNDPETVKLVNEYLRWEGDFGGKKFNQGKIFK